jgi:Coenzyme PQQ synthesis protein D (PqqD)
MPITLDSVVIRTRGLMSTPLEDNIVILNPARDNYVALDEIGRRVWELLAVPSGVGDLCHQVTQEFQGDSTRIGSDILAFLNELAAEGLLYVAKA